MAGDYGRFKRGGVEYPLVASPFVQARERIDPPLHAALAYWKAMIEKHAGAYFNALVTAAGLADLSGKVVAEAIGYDPLPYFTAAQYRLPLLAVFRTEEKFEPQTVAWYKSVGDWTLLYILPTLTAAQANALVHFLKAVSAIIVDRTEQGYDPDYQSGAEVWGLSGISEIGVVSAEYGAIPQLETNLRFPTCKLALIVEEREQKNPGLDQLGGLDGSIRAANGDPAQDVPVAEFTWENT